MKRFLTTFFALLLVLCLSAGGALAEGIFTSEEDAPYTMFTLTLENISGDALDAFLSAPLTARMGFGAEADPVRGFIMFGLGTGEENALSAFCALEDDTVKLYVDGLGQDIAFSVGEMIDSLVAELLPEGMTLQEASPEFQQALADVLNACSAEFSAVFAEDMIETAHYYGMPTEDAWRSYWVSYPALMHAVPAGEEEITLFGEKYVAKKYTYDNQSMTYEEMEEYRAALESWKDSSSEALSAEFDEALARLEKETLKLLDEQYSTLVTTEDMTASYTYSDQGTFYMVEEVLGILESGSYTMNMGEEYGTLTSVVNSACKHSGGDFRMEHVESTSDGQAAQIILRMTEHEDGTIETLEEENASYTFTNASGEANGTYEAGTKTTRLVKGDSMVVDTIETVSQKVLSDASYNYSTSSQHHMELTMESDTRGTGVVTMTETSDGISTDIASGNLIIEAGYLPEGELLRLSGQPFNPFTATEEEQTALMEQVEKLLLDFFNSLVPAPEPAPGVGGALLGGK